ncbi:MAG TPA: hydrogenase nickel incorporation protein HypB [bacterium]|nr:hydrogenase nickel incorporation protein HypB [bacterium]HOL47739.1 hydrogenase nickel incorporation protein HypB [bacterium]HPQ18027.1 hydrogenase nickel incorporation protein HypB [bacterium]
MKIQILKNIIDENDVIAKKINEKLNEFNIFCMNFMSSPGAGKTEIITQLIEKYYNKKRIGVIEGDVSTTIDAEKLAKHKIPVIQINTDIFGGGCHLSASLIEQALEKFDLSKLDILIIENIGNLICPGEYNLGEHKKIVVISLTEGVEKPLKYPLLFRRADAVLINKVDLEPYLDTKAKDVIKNIRTINSKVQIFSLSAKTGEGIDNFIDWINNEI